MCLVEAPGHVFFAVWAFASLIFQSLLIVGSIVLFEGGHGWYSNDLALRRNALLSLIPSRLLLGVGHQVLEVGTALPQLDRARIKVQSLSLVSMVRLDDLPGDGGAARVDGVLMVPEEAVLLPCNLEVSLREAALIKQALAAARFEGLLSPRKDHSLGILAVQVRPRGGLSA